MLQEKKQPLSRGQICNLLNEDGSKVSHHLKKLLRFGDIHAFEVDRETAKKMFGEKAPSRRLKLYYIPVTKIILMSFSLVLIRL